ncbi:MBL fold metallo-hydrolase [Parasediminibacterium sp. JCM 36343]|uniref:MBL fold metallo-hydrolase n=1 Tax=Parasediminibacterium sp. JCM 36343 TaxID=3374279 RepID=UPI00397BAF50
MKSIHLFFCLLLSASLLAQPIKQVSFHVVPLGVMGGIDESNLSAYMVAPVGTNQYICFDAGTIHAGIEKAIANKAFSIPASDVIRQYIKGYFISHAHMDHVAGMVITSPEDSSKTIYALQSCMKMLENNYFNGEAWANFGDEGKAPLIKKYHYKTLAAGEEAAVDNTPMLVKAFPLSHGNPYQSTAFLVHEKDAYILYLGDTGPDEIEKSNKLQLLWQEIAPLVKTGKLKGIFIEASFPDDQSDNKLFGHLTPKWLMQEMDVLSSFTGKEAMNGLNIIITHVKPPLTRVLQLQKELKLENKLGLKLIFPQQGKAFDL